VTESPINRARPPSRGRRPWIYEIRVQGHLDDVWADWFEGLHLARRPDGTSTLVGPVPDQAALHSILARIRDLGLPLLSLKQNEEETK
jgi:hypothetical protein